MPEFSKWCISHAGMPQQVGCTTCLIDAESYDDWEVVKCPHCEESSPLYNDEGYPPDHEDEGNRIECEACGRFSTITEVYYKVLVTLTADNSDVKK